MTVLRGGNSKQFLSRSSMGLSFGEMIKGGVHCLDVIRCGFNFITAMIGFAQEGVFRPRGDDGTFDGWELE